MEAVKTTSVQCPAQVPACLSQVIHRLLEKNPRQRYQTALEVQAALSQCLDQLQNPPDAVGGRARATKLGKQTGGINRRVSPSEQQELLGLAASFVGLSEDHLHRIQGIALLLGQAWRQELVNGFLTAIDRVRTQLETTRREAGMEPPNAVSIRQRALEFINEFRTVTAQAYHNAHRWHDFEELASAARGTLDPFQDDSAAILEGPEALKGMRTLLSELVDRLHRLSGYLTSLRDRAHTALFSTLTSSAGSQVR